MAPDDSAGNDAPRSADDASTGADEISIHDDIQALLSEHIDGSLDAAGSARVAAHLATCAECTAARDELREMRSALSGLGKLKQPPPPAFREQVTDTIHRRSAGRFFSRRTLGDRVPFGALLIAALVVLLGVAGALWTSGTGSLRLPPQSPKPPPPSQPVAPP